jgi:hypothetical protein
MHSPVVTSKQVMRFFHCTMNMRRTTRRISRCLTLIAVHTCESPQTPHAAIGCIISHWQEWCASICSPYHHLIVSYSIDSRSSVVLRFANCRLHVAESALALRSLAGVPDWAGSSKDCVAHPGTLWLTGCPGTASSTCLHVNLWKNHAFVTLITARGIQNHPPVVNGVRKLIAQIQSLQLAQKTTPKTPTHRETPIQNARRV